MDSINGPYIPTGRIRLSLKVKKYYPLSLKIPQLLPNMFGFLVRDSIYAIARYMLSPVCPSVRLSHHGWISQKTVEVRIMQPSPQSSPMTSFLALNFTVKFQREDRERGAEYERDKKIRNFQQISRRISETVQDRTKGLKVATFIYRHLQGNPDQQRFTIEVAY